MIRGARIGLRARLDSDLPVLQQELYDDVRTHARADGRPWRPVAEGEPSPYRVREGVDDAAFFSVVELASSELAGEAVLWAIDRHNRAAHLGLSLRPAFRGRGFGADTVRLLCEYGFAVRGLRRLQVETLADNAAMIAAAEASGFRVEGRLRRAAWVYGQEIDQVVLGLLADEWTPPDAAATP